MVIEKQFERCRKSLPVVPYRFQYRTKEAAALLGISQRTLATMVQEETIASHKLGAIRLFARRDLRAFVETLRNNEQQNGASAN